MPMRERRLARGLIVALPLAALALSPVACATSTSQHTLAHDGGFRVTLRASCPQTMPGCDLAKQRAATIPVLSRRLADRTDVRDALVRADGATNTIVELPGVANDAGIVHTLTDTGAIAFLDAGDTMLAPGTTTAGETCTISCQAGQYPVVFTGGEVAGGSVSTGRDPNTGGTFVAFAFAGHYRQQFAERSRWTRSSSTRGSSRPRSTPRPRSPACRPLRPRSLPPTSDSGRCPPPSRWPATRA